MYKKEHIRNKNDFQRFGTLAKNKSSFIQIRYEFCKSIITICSNYLN